jgi:hypothetical protein
MRRVVRPGGWVAVLENDTLHHVILPWPPALELAIRRAELDALTQSSSVPAKYYVGRRLNELFRYVGLRGTQVEVRTTVRQAPLDVDERTFLQGYLCELGCRVIPHLDIADLLRFNALVSGGSPDCMMERDDLTVTWLDVLAVGRV